MQDVAVVILEDTGVIETSVGKELSDISHVRCDSSNLLRPVENADLLTEEQGRGHTVDGADFDPDCYGNDRFTVVVYFSKNKKGQRVAKFHYRPKNKNDIRPTDPFYLVVVQGDKYIKYIGKSSSLPNKKNKDEHPAH